MAETDERFYGRRKGRSLSVRRQALCERLLPRLRIRFRTSASHDLRNLFTGRTSDIWLEIGFGAGEHLAWQAAHQPDIGFIGCEPYINGVAKLLSRIERDDLRNIRIFDDDARLLFSAFPDASIGRVFLLFPDPWPKRKHRKRRFVTREVLDRLARIMRPGAELRVASDSGAFVRTTLSAIHRHEAFRWLDNGPSDWRLRPDDWPPTRYEKKALREGRQPVYLTFVRR
jgi:tRNA (guanine-N7-)-methyltransferase